MELLAAVLLACGLAVDSSLVALAQGLCARRPRMGRALELAAVFGGFQGAMLVAGWFAGEPVARLFSAFDHWIAFGLLAVIGVRTIREGYAHEEGARTEMGMARILVAGVATSIDALAAGFGLSLVGQSVVAPAVAAAAITAAGSMGAYLGASRLARGFEKQAHWVAGLVLIGIGAQILFEHRGEL